MNILIVGANGYMGPHVVEALAPHHRLRITDIKPAPKEIRQRFPDHDYRDLDVTRQDEVARAAEGMDTIVNLSVVRNDPLLAFHVNTIGCYHIMRAAAKQGIRRVVNTGPHFTVAGPSYEQFDFAIGPDVPPHPGTGLYPITKSLGQEVCRVLAAAHEIYVIDLLYYILRDDSELQPGTGGVPFLVTWRDAAEAVRLAVEIEEQRLPSRSEIFFILDDLPQRKFVNEKARRILGFEPRGIVPVLWERPRPGQPGS